MLERKVTYLNNKILYNWLIIGIVMKKEDYLKIREIGKGLNDKILNSNKNRDRVLKSAKDLGLLIKDNIIFNDDKEYDLLMEYILYESELNNKKLLNIFLESNYNLSLIEENLLNAMLNSNLSLFEVIGIQKETLSVELHDLLNNKIMKLIDVGFSNTANLGIIIATRLIKISESEFMSSGITFLFSSLMKDKIIRELSNEVFKNRRGKKINLFLFFLKMSRYYGELVKTYSVSEIEGK
ncbi:MAG: hypothetical protein A2475_02935 [Ignavibacteria bacterium RIFOXYC2_FULL_35_21]|nr:MAG: hypothetical protein A2220_14250 [Ignavibacteria bacterium RIFOXYA2_FULL_35_10]OGV22788.1 MAG: hypothetical protein A2475_02935 [Ignavibacteria bacterium RIFOXYC2_FULL_35_21]